MESLDNLTQRHQDRMRPRNEYFCIRHGTIYRTYNCGYCIREKTIVCEKLNEWNNKQYRG